MDRKIIVYSRKHSTTDRARFERIMKHMTPLWYGSKVSKGFDVLVEVDSDKVESTKETLQPLADQFEYNCRVFEKPRK